MKHVSFFRRVMWTEEPVTYIGTYPVQGNSIHSSGRPYRIRLVSDIANISKERGVAQITVEIVDEKGVPVFLADNEVTCHIDGPVRLLGLEAGNNEDMGDYKDEKQRVFHGRLIAYVQAIGKKGEAVVKFTSPWLQASEIVLNVD